MTRDLQGRNRVRSVARMLLAVTLTLTGCTLWDRDNAADQTLVPFAGLTKDLRIRWTAEPGIDLLTGPAVILRAYRESYILAGLLANPAFYYPGFEHAVPPNDIGPPHDNGRNSLIRPMVTGDKYLSIDGFQTTTPIVGTWRQHILSLTGDRKIGYTVKMCDWDYATATRQSDGQYRYPHRNPPQPLDTANPITGAQVYRITLAPPAPDRPDPTTTPQRGTAPNTDVDVFGAWTVRASLVLYTAPQDSGPNVWPKDEYDRDRQSCAEKAPDPFEKRRFFLLGEHPRDDYPTLPAEPGWPAAGT